MYNNSNSTNPYGVLGTLSGVGLQGGARNSVLSRVLGLLGFSFLFTAGGAALGTNLGRGAFFPALILSFVALFGLMFAKERAPLNLILLYVFATLEGVTLGLLLQSYIAAGLGGIVIDAAATTASITLAAGAYGATTQRNLTGLGSILFIGLIGVIVASILGIFIHLAFLHLMISMVAAVIFTGFLVYDFNRVANTPQASQGNVILMTVSIYLDIYNLFLNLLFILQSLSGNSRD